MKMRDEHTAKINFRRNVDMKIRNLLAALLVISLCICLPVQVSAMGAPVELTAENVSHYAYMDLDVAPAAWNHFGGPGTDYFCTFLGC